MSNWPLKFRNNKEDSPAHFLDDLKRFKRGYQITGRNILENLDALLTEDAKDWCLINKNSWRTLLDFFREFTRTYMDEKCLEEIKQKIKFRNQKRNQDIHPYLIEIRKLFTKLHPRKSLEWELRRAYENLRIEYKMYIKRNDFDRFEELEDLSKEWEIELKKSEIKRQVLQITEPRRENNENQNSQNRKLQYIPTVQTPLNLDYCKNFNPDSEIIQVDSSITHMIN